MTTEAFPVLTAAEHVFYTLLWTPMFTAGENWLELQIPFLDLPVVKQMDEKILKVLTDAIFTHLVLLVDVAAIRLVDSARQSAYEAASEQLVLIGETQGVHSDDYQKALTTALDRFRNFGRLDG